MTTTIQPILCSEDGFRGEYKVRQVRVAVPDGGRLVNSDTAVCQLCGHEVRIGRDIEPNLEPGERVTITGDGYLATVAEEDADEWLILWDGDGDRYKVAHVTGDGFEFWEIRDWQSAGMIVGRHTTEEQARREASEWNGVQA